ncbi:MAG: molybdate ABC transporter substrate-binding protein [Candidatus Omnitrophota bacterium]|nr:molybdate ABC transporter substrate-binding protein [Candidatus Omnitrophota bacterium]
MKNKVFIVFLMSVLAVSIATYYHSTSYKRQPLEIYVPCGMIVPFQEAIKSFVKENPGANIKPSFETGSILVRLILNKGKRPDIFVSTGATEMKNLVEKSLIDTETLKEFGKFNLVLYTSSSNPANITNLNDLIKPEVKIIAISDPRFNSVGSYAEEALQNAGIWGSIKDKLVLTDSPIQALTFVASGKAQAGIHYDTCPFDTAPEKIDSETLKVVQKIPAQYHNRIVSEIALLKEAKNKKLGAMFIQFLTGAKGQEILKKSGIETPHPSLSPKGERVKVTIEAYYPFNEEHKSVGDYLKTFEKKYPGKISVRLIDFRASDGYDEWRKTGLSCGGIIINGKSEFDIDTPDGKKTIRFLRRVDTFWSREDFEKVINSIMNQ